MEYIQGDDLKHHLDKGVRYSLEQSLKMIRDLLSALNYAHTQGIVHRDIKPANMLIEPGGRVKLTDFGVARMQDSGDATRTQGNMVGTLKYMSPEQVQGQKIDSRADLFSVGIVLYQLLTDKRPFDGDNDFSIIHQIIGHTPAPPSSFNARLPSAIDAVVARALAKDREQRFATARDFSSALQSAIRRAEDATIVPPANPSRKPDASATDPNGQASLAGASSATGGSTVTQELELVYWKDVKDSTDREELIGFLDKFPAGIYADLARRRLRRLAGANSTPDQTVLSGRSIPGIPASQQDLEATRAHTATTPLVAARPTPSGEDFASTVTEPAVTRTPAGDSAAADAPSEPPASWLPSPSLPLRRAGTQEEALRRVRGARRSGGGRCRGPVPDGKSRSRANRSEPRQCRILSRRCSGGGGAGRRGCGRRRCGHRTGTNPRPRRPRRHPPAGRPPRPRSRASRRRLRRKIRASPFPSPCRSGKSRGRCPLTPQPSPRMRWRPARTSSSCSRSSAWPNSARNQGREITRCARSAGKKPGCARTAGSATSRGCHAGLDPASRRRHGSGHRMQA